MLGTVLTFLSRARPRFEVLWITPLETALSILLRVRYPSMLGRTSAWLVTAQARYLLKQPVAVRREARAP